MSEAKTQNALNEQSEWHDAISDKPKNKGWYICTVIIPCVGRYSKRMDILYWDGDGWSCEDMIVTHWRKAPEYPTEVVIPIG